MTTHERLHAFDAVRASALLLGVVFHAGFSFIPGMFPGIWAIVDSSPSTALSVLLFTSHSFRMSLFFLIAGFFARMAFHRRGARGFWADRSKRILLPLVVGWLVLAPTLGLIWYWGLLKTFGGSLPAPPADLPAPPPGAFPLTHLWFLYYLLLLYALVLLCRATALTIDRGGLLRRGVDRAVAAVVRRGAAAPLLALPVSLALYARHDWIAWFGIPTPDQSLIPQVTSVVAYGTALGFGWLLHRQPDLLTAWATQWPAHLAAAVAATAACLVALGPTPALVPLASGLGKLGIAVGYAMATWCWSLAIAGLALRFLRRPSGRIRYVADASYWIYLVHLPVVVALQVLVGHLPWHWTLKFPIILASSLLVLFASYHVLVRSTFIGQVLNGRKYARRSAPFTKATDTPDPGPPALADPSSPVITMEPRSAADRPAAPAEVSRRVVASLRGVHKRYGSIAALSGLDLDVHAGELLAVLGPNGAGKSTAIALWLGLLQPDEGTASIYARSPLETDVRRVAGVMMQEVGLTPELRVRELVELTASYYAAPLPTNETLGLVGIASLAGRKYGTLSGGQKRQVQFALAVCGRPSLLFLDEPTAGLDVQARETMWGTIRHLLTGGCSIVLTTHYLEEAEAIANRVAVLAGGRLIASGTVDEVRQVVSLKRISCTSAITVDEVRTWPGVAESSRDARRLHITATDAELVVRRLFEADAHLRDLEVRQAGLAEAFAQLTKEAA